MEIRQLSFSFLKQTENKLDFAVVQLKCRVVLLGILALIQLQVTKALNARLMRLMTHFTASRNDVDDYANYSTRKPVLAE